MTELNPENEVVHAMRELWQKALACLMVKLSIEEVRLSRFDFNNLSNKFGGETATIVISENGETLRLRIMPQSEAIKLAKKSGDMAP